MNTVPLPPITHADDDQDDLFAERTLECQGCGASFTTTSPRASDRCVECKAGLKVKVVCPVCDLIHAVALLAPHKLCLSCSADMTMTLASACVRLENAQAAADARSARLDADVAHADEKIRARFEAAVGMLTTGQLGDRQLTPKQVRAAWEKALAKGDDLSPLLALYDAAATAALTQQRASVAVRAAMEAMER